MNDLLTVHFIAIPFPTTFLPKYFQEFFGDRLEGLVGCRVKPTFKEDYVVLHHLEFFFIYYDFAFWNGCGLFKSGVVYSFEVIFHFVLPLSLFFTLLLYHKRGCLSTPFANYFLIKYDKN